MKELRERARLTQKDVATAVHVSRSTVSKWESGERRPDISVLIPLAHLYLVSVERLIETVTGK